jgi:hypothetical protein
LYALQLQPWLEAFGRDQLMVMFMEDMVSHDAVQAQLGKVFDFLGLPPHSIIDTHAKNTRAYEPMDERTKARLSAFYAPFNQQLFQILNVNERRWEARE